MIGTDGEGSQEDVGWAFHIAEPVEGDVANDGGAQPLLKQLLQDEAVVVIREQAPNINSPMPDGLLGAILDDFVDEDGRTASVLNEIANYEFSRTRWPAERHLGDIAVITIVLNLIGLIDDL